MSEKYAGADWIESSLKEKLSPFGRKVADILGQVWRGIYHIGRNGSCLHKVEWTHMWMIRVNVHEDLDTFDGQKLTELVIAAHEACIRLSIQPCNMQTLRLEFSKRYGREGRMFDRHPSMEMAINYWHKNLSLGEENPHGRSEEAREEG